MSGDALFRIFDALVSVVSVAKVDCESESRAAAVGVVRTNRLLVLRLSST